jgi:hypothetical protein
MKLHPKLERVVQAVVSLDARPERVVPEIAARMAVDFDVEHHEWDAIALLWALANRLPAPSRLRAVGGDR